MGKNTLCVFDTRNITDSATNEFIATIKNNATDVSCTEKNTFSVPAPLVI